MMSSEQEEERLEVENTTILFSKSECTSDEVTSTVDDHIDPPNETNDSDKQKGLMNVVGSIGYKEDVSLGKESTQATNDSPNCHEVENRTPKIDPSISVGYKFENSCLEGGSSSKIEDSAGCRTPDDQSNVVSVQKNIADETPSDNKRKKITISILNEENTNSTLEDKSSALNEDVDNKNSFNDLDDQKELDNVTKMKPDQSHEGELSCPVTSSTTGNEAQSEVSDTNNCGSSKMNLENKILDGMKNQGCIDKDLESVPGFDNGSLGNKCNDFGIEDNTAPKSALEDQIDRVDDLASKRCTGNEQNSLPINKENCDENTGTGHTSSKGKCLEEEFEMFQMLCKTSEKEQDASQEKETTPVSSHNDDLSKPAKCQTPLEASEESSAGNNVEKTDPSENNELFDSPSIETTEDPTPVESSFVTTGPSSADKTEDSGLFDSTDDQLNEQFSKEIDADLTNKDVRDHEESEELDEGTNFENKLDDIEENDPGDDTVKIEPILSNESNNLGTTSESEQQCEKECTNGLSEEQEGLLGSSVGQDDDHVESSFVTTGPLSDDEMNASGLVDSIDDQLNEQFSKEIDADLTNKDGRDLEESEELDEGSNFENKLDDIEENDPEGDTVMTEPILSNESNNEGTTSESVQQYENETTNGLSEEQECLQGSFMGHDDDPSENVLKLEPVKVPIVLKPLTKDELLLMKLGQIRPCSIAMDMLTPEHIEAYTMGRYKIISGTPHKHRRCISPNLRKKIRIALNDGMTIKQVAATYDVSRSTVERIKNKKHRNEKSLKTVSKVRSDLSPNSKRALTFSTRVKIMGKLERGVPIESLSREYGINRSTLKTLRRMKNQSIRERQNSSESSTSQEGLDSPSKEQNKTPTSLNKSKIKIYRKPKCFLAALMILVMQNTASKSLLISEIKKFLCYLFPYFIKEWKFRNWKKNINIATLKASKKYFLKTRSSESEGGKEWRLTLNSEEEESRKEFMKKATRSLRNEAESVMRRPELLESLLLGIMRLGTWNITDEDLKLSLEEEAAIEITIVSGTNPLSPCVKSLQFPLSESSSSLSVTVKKEKPDSKSNDSEIKTESSPGKSRKFPKNKSQSNINDNQDSADLSNTSSMSLEISHTNVNNRLVNLLMGKENPSAENPSSLMEGKKKSYKRKKKLSTPSVPQSDSASLLGLAERGLAKIKEEPNTSGGGESEEDTMPKIVSVEEGAYHMWSSEDSISDRQDTTLEPLPKKKKSAKTFGKSLLSLAKKGESKTSPSKPDQSSTSSNNITNQSAHERDGDCASQASQDNLLNSPPPSPTTVPPKKSHPLPTQQQNPPTMPPTQPSLNISWGFHHPPNAYGMGGYPPPVPYPTHIQYSQGYPLGPPPQPAMGPPPGFPPHYQRPPHGMLPPPMVGYGRPMINPDVNRPMSSWTPTPSQPSVRSQSPSKVGDKSSVPKVSDCIETWRKVFPWMHYTESERLFKCSVCDWACLDKSDVEVFRLQTPKDVYLVAGQLRYHRETNSHRTATFKKERISELISHVYPIMKGHLQEISGVEDIIKTVSDLAGGKFPGPQESPQKEYFMTYMIKHIAECIEEKLFESLSNSPFFSVITVKDKDYAIIRWLNSKGESEEHFFCSRIGFPQDAMSCLTYLKKKNVNMNKLISYSILSNLIDSNIENAVMLQVPVRYPPLSVCLEWLHKASFLKNLFQQFNVLTKLCKSSYHKFAAFPEAAEFVNLAEPYSHNCIVNERIINFFFGNIKVLRKIAQDIYKTTGNMEAFGFSALELQDYDSLMRCSALFPKLHAIMNSKHTNSTSLCDLLKDFRTKICQRSSEIKQKSSNEYIVISLVDIFLSHVMLTLLSPGKEITDIFSKKLRHLTSDDLEKIFPNLMSEYQGSSANCLSNLHSLRVQLEKSRDISLLQLLAILVSKPGLSPHYKELYRLYQKITVLPFLHAHVEQCMFNVAAAEVFLTSKVEKRLMLPVTLILLEGPTVEHIDKDHILNLWSKKWKMSLLHKNMVIGT